MNDLKAKLIQMLKAAGRSWVLFRGNVDFPVILPTYPETFKQPMIRSPLYFWCPVELLNRFHFEIPMEIRRRLEKGYL